MMITQILLRSLVLSCRFYKWFDKLLPEIERIIVIMVRIQTALSNQSFPNYAHALKFTVYFNFAKWVE